jgi:hypothetical protein
MHHAPCEGRANKGSGKCGGKSIAKHLNFPYQAMRKTLLVAELFSFCSTPLSLSSRMQMHTRSAVGKSFFAVSSRSSNGVSSAPDASELLISENLISRSVWRSLFVDEKLHSIEMNYRVDAVIRRLE